MWDAEYQLEKAEKKIDELVAENDELKKEIARYKIAGTQLAEATILGTLKDLFEKAFETVEWKAKNEKYLGDADNGGYTDGQIIDEVYDLIKNFIPKE